MPPVKQRLERLGQRVALDLTPLIHPEFLEEALVDLLPDEIRRVGVLPVAPCRHSERLVEQLLDIAEVLVARFDLSLRSSHRPGEPIHLALEQVRRHGTVVVSPHEGGALTSELVQLLVGPFGLAVRFTGLSGHLGVHSELDAAHR